MAPIHPNFVAAAYAHADRMMKPGPRRHANETTCPYCGHSGDDHLVGTIRVGAKDQVTGIPMTAAGYTVPAAGNRDTEILVIYCTRSHIHPITGEESWAAIDPLAYLSPAVFYGEKENVSLFPDF
ncbi:MAG TPA: hypothetical protein VF178_14910 [Gemmatimonadaceae bacterium]